MLALSVEWIGIIVFALIAGQFAAGLLSLVMPPRLFSWFVWLPTPIVVFLLLTFRLQDDIGRFRWPGAGGVWWSLAAMIPAAWIGGFAGGRLYDQLFPCVGDCVENLAPLAGVLVGAAVSGLTVMVGVLLWISARTQRTAAGT